MGMIEDRLTPDFEGTRKKAWKFTPLRCVIKIRDKWYLGMHLGGRRYVPDMEITEKDAEDYLEYPVNISDDEGDGMTGKTSLFTTEENIARSENLGKD